MIGYSSGLESWKNREIHPPAFKGDDTLRKGQALERREAPRTQEKN